MEDPKLSITEASKTLKVISGGDGSPSDFMIFNQSRHSHMENYVNHVTVIVFTNHIDTNIYIYLIRHNKKIMKVQLKS